MVVVNYDGSVIYSNYPLPVQQLQCGYTELEALPGSDLTAQIEQLLALAFDSLGLHVFEMRVREERPV